MLYLQGGRSMSQVPDRTGPWTPDEDAVLIRAVARLGPQNWSAIAGKIPGRNGKSCRLR